MAIKQHATEIVQENSNNSASNTNTNFDKILNEIEEFIDNFQPHNVIDQSYLNHASNYIVSSLANFHSSRDAEAIKILKCNMSKMQKLFEDFKKNRSENTQMVAQACMKSLYKQITKQDSEPNILASSILNLVENDKIRNACIWLLSQFDNTSDECIKRAFKLLCFWLRGPNSTPLHLWIIEILKVLRVNLNYTKKIHIFSFIAYFLYNFFQEQERFDILLDLAAENISELFITLIIPFVRPRSKPIVFLMLASIRHTPKIFHKIIPRTTNVLKQIQSEDNSSFQDLLCFFSQLIDLFPGYDEKYEDIVSIKSQILWKQ